MSIPRATIILAATLLIVSLSCSGDNGTNGGGLQAPSGLIAEVVSPSSARLSWLDNSDNESAFAIWRNQFGVFDHADTIGADQTFFTATNLEDSTQYSYYVVAVNGGSVSGPSNTVQVITFHSASVPDIPANPFPADSAIAQALESRMTWLCSDPDNEPMIYEIYFGRTNPPPFAVRQDSTTFVPPSSLEASVTYFWRVVASDTGHNRRSSPIWTFATSGPGNQPPWVPANPNPADNANSIGIGTAISWQGFDPDGDPLNYDVYFGDTDPPELVGNQTASSYDPPGSLNYNTVYYWRIVAHDSAQETSGPLWRFTTTTPGNDPPNSPSSPDPLDGALDIATDVMLSWVGSDPNNDTLTYDVYFGTELNPPLVSGDQSANTYPTGQLQNSTLYYWRIVAKDRSQSQTSGPIWRFTTIPANQPPAVPSSPTPPDQQTGVPIDAQVSWQCSDPEGDSIRYDVFFGFSNPPPFVGNQAATAYDPPGNLNNNATYFWRVTARDSLGNQTQGPVWRFTTAQLGNQPPSQPSNPNPTDGQTGVLLDASLSWQGSDPENDPLTFDVYFGQSNPPSLVGTQTATSYDPPGDLVGGSTYYWQIVARDDHAHQTPGPIWSFSTVGAANQPPAAPSSPSPADGQYGIARNAILTWQASDPDSDPLNFDVYFGTASTPPLVGNQTETSYDPPGDLGDSVAYYWRIVVKDDHDHETSGPVWMFTSVGAGNAAPTAPSNPSPTNGATGVELDASIAWQATDPDGDPLTYDVYFGQSNPPVFVRNQAGASYNPPGDLLGGTTYYWQIIVRDNHQHQTSGPVWSFTTVSPNRPPNQPSNPSPSNGQVNVPLNSAVSWQGSDPDGDALTYNVNFGTNNPPPFVRNQGEIVYDPPGELTAGTTYYWRITALDPGGEQTMGPLWSFTTLTQNQPPSAPASPTPIDGATGVAVSINLSWQATDPDGDPLTYDIYLGTSSSPPFVRNQSGATYDPPSDLQGGTRYYWRIVAHDDHSHETSGPVWSFTTQTQNGPPTVPSGPSPADGQSDVSISADLSWQASTDPDGDPVVYDVYFGTSSSPPLVAPNRSGTSYGLPPLQNSTIYYWRIVAKDNHGNQSSGPTWSFVTVSNLAPDPPSNPRPSDGETGVENDDDLRWDASDPEEDPLNYDVYFGTTNPPPFVRNQDSRRFDPPGRMQDGTTYYWQIVVHDDHSNQTAGPIWHFITENDINQPPLPPSSPQPPHGSIDVAVDALLSWQDSDPDGDTLSFDIYFGLSSPPPFVGNQPAMSYDPPGDMQNGVGYFWGVVARDGIYIVPGPTWSFTTASANSPPLAAANPQPADGTADVDPAVILSWQGNDPDGDPLTYDVFFGGVNPPHFVGNQEAALYDPAVDLAPGTTYYWSITSNDNHEHQTPGPTWSLTTLAENQPPSAPTDPMPTDGATDVPLASTISWQASDPDSDSLTFNLYFGNVNPPPFIQNQSSNNYDPPDDMLPATTYYWSISVFDGQGHEVAGPVWSFTTVL